MPKDQANNREKDREVRQGFEQSHFENKSQDIVKAFIENKKGEYDKYFQVNDKENIINDFKTYVERRYGEGVLQHLLQSGQLDVEFNQIANKGFTIDDFLSSTTGSIIKQKISSVSSEAEAMQNILMDCYKQRNILSPTDQSRLPFEDFLREIDVKVEKDQGSNITNIRPLPKSRPQTVRALKESWDHFVRSHSTDSKIQEYDFKLMNADYFDPSEKVTCIATTQTLYTKMLQFGGSKTQQLLEIWDSIFDPDVNDKPVSAFAKWSRLDGLKGCLKDFFAIIVQKNILTKSEIKQLQDLGITSRICVNIGKSFGELLDGNYDVQKFSQLSRDAQKLTNALVTTDMITKVNDTFDSIDTAVENFARTFEMPGTMRHFFDQFPHNDIKDRIPPNKKKEFYDLQAEIASLQEEASGAEHDGNHTEEEKLNARILELVKKKQTLIDHDMKPNMGEYIQFICHKTEENAQLLGKDIVSSTELSHALHALYTHHRDSTILNSAQQNVLMKASMVAQLAKVKNSNVFTDLGYNFNKYSQFLIDLFDLTNKRSIITTKDHEPFEIIFESKRLVGKPYDRQTISLEDMKDLSQLRMEFVIDLKHDTDRKVERFLQSITGGPKSQVIMNFFGATHPTSGFPATITESTQIQLTDKNGKSYTGYLSPGYLSSTQSHLDGEDSIDSYGTGRDDSKRADLYANTFVLYDQPVDQLNDQRKMVTKESDGSLKSGELYTPITLNADNFRDRTIEVLHKKATLSDKTINALALGHMMAQHYDSGTLLDATADKNLYNIQDKINEYTQHRGTDIDTHPTDHDKESHDDVVSSYSEMSPSKQLLDGRNKLFPDNNKDKIELKEGQRFAFLPNRDTYPIGAPSIPEHRTFLSGTVKNIQQKDGKIIGFDLIIENLTANSTSVGTRTRTITPENIHALTERGEKNIFESISYLGEQHNNSDYLATLERLMSLFPKKSHPDFGRSSLDGVTMKSDGVFQKKDRDIYRFIAVDATESDKQGDKGKYHVEYTIEKKGNNNYHISSTGYAVNDPNDKGKDKKTLASFDLTTDLTGLLLIIANKKLTPYNKEEHDILYEQGDHNGPIPTKRPNKFWSIGTVMHVFKDGMFKKMVDAWKHKREESGKQELEYRIFQEYNIYRRLEHSFGGLLEKFDMNFLEHLADEEEPKAMEYGWKKIEHELQFLEKFHHSYNYGMLKTGPSKNKGANAICEEYVEHAIHNMEHGGNCTYKQRYKVAAALIYMIKQYKNGYARILRRFPRGTYIKILLGEHAHSVFLKKYKEKQKELENGKTGNQIQEQLMTMEYNFIAHNIRGGSNQDESVRDLDFDGNQGGGSAAENENAWYYQRLYSRKYGNELATAVGGIKNISVEVSNENIKKHIDAGSRLHMKNEYYGHISQLRMDAAIEELVAMQQLATTKTQADEVVIAVMLAILNGGFMHYLGNNTRDNLRRVCRNSGIPFVNRMEHHDAPEKLQRLLCIATAHLGDKSFEKFTYKDKSEQKYTYKASDFGPLKRRDGDLDGLRKAFADNRLDDKKNPQVRKQVLDFIHMDNIMEDNDNNMMAIWKQKKKIEDGQLVVNNRQITLEDRKVVDNTLGELYFNKDRGVRLEEYNRAPRGNGGAHTRTMIDNVYWGLLNKTKGNVFEPGVGDHAASLWTNINSRIPTGTLKSTQKYKLAYYVDEFFRVFSGIGGIDYNKDMIEKFYKHINIITHQRNLSQKDKIRLIWFYAVEQAYHKGSIPPIVEEGLTKYLTFFENNIDLFDQDMASMHRHPGEGADLNKNFGSVFAHAHANEEYYPDKEWMNQKPYDRNIRYKNANRDGILIINGEMEEHNIHTRKHIGKSVDDLIDERRGGIASAGGGHQSSPHNHMPRKIESIVKSTNRDMINLDNIPKESSPHKVLTTEDKKKKQEDDALIKKIQQQMANSDLYD